MSVTDRETTSADETPEVAQRQGSPPRRPRSVEELEFQRRRPVRWFSPSTLARSGIKVVLSMVLGEYLDKRELQQSLPPRIPPERIGDTDMWVDFVADTADGFNPTYTVAWCLSQRHVTVSGHQLPRARLLVLGGDQVYPYATAQEYEDRFRGPYEAALPWCEEAAPRIVAIPGNHDWYDGLTGFMRVFAQKGWVGGRERAQRRSYFAERLPGRFWLWGIDIQAGAYLDAAQIDYFQTVAQMMADGDRLILCTAKPSWADVPREANAYDNLAYVEKHLVPDHVVTVLMLSGDKHHYARYDAPALGGADRARITAGGGGAFLSSTNTLSDHVCVPEPRSAGGNESLKLSDREQLTLGTCYPDKGRSRLLAFRALLLGWYNPSFAALIGMLYLALFWLTGSMSGLAGDISFTALLVDRDVASVILILMLWLLLSAFFDAPAMKWEPLRYLLRFMVGALHTGAHLCAQAGVAWIALQVAPGSMILAGVVVAVLGAVVGTVVFGAYLLAAFFALKSHATETFSAFRYEGHKNFLRIHVGIDEVTVYPIAIDRTCRDWTVNHSDERPDASYLDPATPIGMRLIEGPIVLR